MHQTTCVEGEEEEEGGRGCGGNRGPPGVWSSVGEGEASRGRVCAPAGGLGGDVVPNVTSRVAANEEEEEEEEEEGEEEEEEEEEGERK